MSDLIFSILRMSAPLLFAVLGALITEYSGALAVFMEGAIIISAFLCTLFTILTGSKFLGFLLAAILTSGILFIVSLFTCKTKSNPFLTGLSLNLFAVGFVPYASNLFLSKSGIIAFEEFVNTQNFIPVNNFFPFIAAICFSVLLFLFLKFTPVGIALRYSGEAPAVLIARGEAPEKYKIFSWTIAGFLASCAGAALVFRLASYTSNISAGRGWTALAAVFLGNKNPFFCILAVLLFSAAEYTVTIMQGSLKIPSSALLSFPYIAALILFVFSKAMNMSGHKSRE